jgi:iron complex transport system substrate-binding protein
LNRIFRIPAVLLLAALCVFSAACASQSSQQTSSTTPTSSKSATALTFTDATNTTVTLAKPPVRIACLVGICEDILAALGMTPVAVNDTLGQNPAFFGAKDNSFVHIGGSFFAPDIEDIAKAQPDLVIGLANVHETLRDALKPIAPLYIMNPSSYSDSIKYLQDIGRLTGRGDKASQVAQSFLNRIAAYESKSPRNKTALLIYGSDVNFNIFTDQSLMGGLLAKVTNYPWTAGAGAAPASDHEPGAIAYSLDKVLARDPDVLFIATLPGGPSLSKQLAANPVWSNLKAVKTHQVYEVDPNFYIFGRGTISLGLALDDAMTKLYPYVFPKPLP